MAFFQNTAPENTQKKRETIVFLGILHVCITSECVQFSETATVFIKIKK